MAKGQPPAFRFEAVVLCEEHLVEIGQAWKNSQARRFFSKPGPGRDRRADQVHDVPERAEAGEENRSWSQATGVTWTASSSAVRIGSSPAGTTPANRAGATQSSLNFFLAHFWLLAGILADIGS
jgi:hypothetical protein